MKKNLIIIGAGAWGSALSIGLSCKYKSIYLYSNKKEFELEKYHKHPKLDVKFKKNTFICYDIKKANNCDDVLIAVPSSAFYEALLNIKPYIHKQNIAWVTKGFDTKNKTFLHISFAKVLKNKKPCFISGPSFAYEVARNKPTLVAVSSKDDIVRKYWLDVIHTNSLRSYGNKDIIGAEIGAATKNVLAIAAGIANGLGYGANTQAALITRGLAEMTRLGLAFGANLNTFMGLTGLGDLVLTASDNLSRNRQFGQNLVKNKKTTAALKAVGATVEGYESCKFVLDLAREKNIEMPICIKVHEVIKEEITPNQAVKELMARSLIDE